MKSLPDDYTLRLVDLPTAVGGLISEGPDGHIDVYINARHSHAGRLRAAEHEFDHWRNDDLHNGLDIREVEGRHANPLPPLIRARDLIPKPKPQPQPQPPRSVPRDPRVLRDLRTLYRIGVITDDMRYDPLLNLPCYDL